MAITLTDAAAQLKLAMGGDFKFSVNQDEGFIMTAFNLDDAEAPNEKDIVPIVIEVLSSGRLLRLFTPRLFTVPEENRGAMGAALSYMMWGLAAVRGEMDLTDGEVRLGIDIPLADDQVLSAQVLRGLLLMLPRTIQEFGAFLDRAAIAGEVDTSLIRTE